MDISAHSRHYLKRFSGSMCCIGSPCLEQLRHDFLSQGQRLHIKADSKSKAPTNPDVIAARVADDCPKVS